jgi:hypothetical protein
MILFARLRGGIASVISSCHQAGAKNPPGLSNPNEVIQKVVPGAGRGRTRVASVASGVGHNTAADGLSPCWGRFFVPRRFTKPWPPTDFAGAASVRTGDAKP